jgi:murein DD-endopeptidase MepM/ murein hydrolase activator NlpD
VTTTARALRPGEVVLLTIRPSRPVASISGTAFNESLHPWSSDGSSWWALVGIPLSARPASYEVALQARSADGRTGTARAPLAIRPGQFSTRRLTVDPQFVNPPASAMERIAAEAKAMADLFGHPTPERLWRGPFRVPVPGESTSSFGRLSILNGESRSRHQGADFRAAEGTPVHAPNAGKVVLVANYYFSGNTVILDHGAGLFSLFAHFSKIDVELGATVKTGDILGEAGATGRVTGPHVHWAVRLNGASVDPLSLAEAVAGIAE